MQKPPVLARLSQDEKGVAYIGLQIKGMQLTIPGKLDVDRTYNNQQNHHSLLAHSNAAHLIGDSIQQHGSTSLQGLRQQQQPIGMTLSEFFMDYDEVAEIRRNMRYQGGVSEKQYKINRVGIFTPMSKVKQLVWKFPILENSDLVNWDVLDDEREWPVLVRAPLGTMYPDDFGRGTAIRWKRGQKGGRVFAVIKKPLDQSQFDIEIPKYFGTVYQVPEFMITWRWYGVSDIDKSDNSITFIRRGQNPLLATINEIRSMSRVKGGKEYFNRMQALIDVVNDYPVQLSDMLTPGEIQATRAYSQQQEQSAGSSNGAEDLSPVSTPDGTPAPFTAPRDMASAAPNSGLETFSPARDAQETRTVEQQTSFAPAAASINHHNPFYQRALEEANRPAPPPTVGTSRYPMTFTARQ